MVERINGWSDRFYDWSMNSPIVDAALFLMLATIGLFCAILVVSLLILFTVAVVIETLERLGIA